MAVFRNIIFVAAIAGLLAGVAMAALQSFATTPLILKAETYENAGATDAGANWVMVPVQWPRQKRHGGLRTGLNARSTP